MASFTPKWVLTGDRYIEISNLQYSIPTGTMTFDIIFGEEEMAHWQGTPDFIPVQPPLEDGVYDIPCTGKFDGVRLVIKEGITIVYVKRGTNHTRLKTGVSEVEFRSNKSSYR